MATRVEIGWLEGARWRREVKHSQKWEGEDRGKEFAEGGSWDGVGVQ